MTAAAEMTDEEVRQQIERTDRFREALRDAIRASAVDPCAPTLNVAGCAGSLTRWTRCPS